VKRVVKVKSGRQDPGGGSEKKTLVKNKIWKDKNAIIGATVE
jgi:hypothetical protein